MIKCSFCGNQIPAGNLVCPSCGQRCEAAAGVPFITSGGNQPQKTSRKKSKKKSKKRKSLLTPLIDIGISVLCWIYFLWNDTFADIQDLWMTAFGSNSHPGSDSRFASGAATGTGSEFWLSFGALSAAVLLVTLLGLIGVVSFFKRLGGWFKREDDE